MTHDEQAAIVIDYFKTAPLQEIRATMPYLRGILDMREAAEPKRKKRSDAGKPKDAK